MTAEVLALSGSYADQAYERVRDRLVMLDIRPGEPIDDDRLATELGFGRTPVREALKRLERERLVIAYPRRGTFATAVDMTDLADISEIRKQLEPTAAARAARTAPAEVRARLTQLAEEIPTYRLTARDPGTAAQGRARSSRDLPRRGQPPSRGHPREPGFARHPNLVPVSGSAAGRGRPCPRTRRPVAGDRRRRRGNGGRIDPGPCRRFRAGHPRDPVARPVACVEVPPPDAPLN